MKEIIILAGGKGSRIQHILPNLPKCLAPVNGKAFLQYQINYLLQSGIEHFIFSLGYLSEQVIGYLNSQFPSLNKTLIVEDQALGTGGAIAKAIQAAKSSHVFITNGDTYFPADLELMERLFHQKHADLILATTEIENPDRFGSLDFDDDGRIKHFHEKKPISKAYINAGFYLISKQAFLNCKLKAVFSFETEILEKKINDWKIYAAPMEKLFIDIGVPEDFSRSQTLLVDRN
ncbi:MAG: sugar phosphate nucleotidyltransferase [Saprospiraceae bacterium]